MPLRKIFLILFLILSVLCLAAGYAVAGHWIGAMSAIVLVPAWWLARRNPDSPLPFLCLSGSIALAVAGILLGTPSLWMIFGSGLALAGWDILLLDAALGNSSSGVQTRQYESRHLQALLLALGSALAATLLGRAFSIQMPFVLLILLLVLMLFALDRVWETLKKTGRS